MSGTPAIAASGLTKRFRRLRGYRDLALYPWRRTTHLAVDDLSLEVGEGELFGLLGENGAGKTTLIRMLTTTLLPTAGSARVGGFDVVREAAAVRRVIGLVAGDERSFYWRLTGRQNLEFFAALYRLPAPVARQRIGDLIDTLGLASYVDERFDSYSTGMKQRFAIARGLLTEPRILFLDEPTRALDPISADEVRRYVTEHLQRELGATILLATHTLSEAQAMCDRIAIVRHGRIVAAGSMDDLRARMGLTDVFELEVGGDAETVRGAIAAIPGVPAFRLEPEADGARVTLPLDERGELLTRVLAAVLAAGATVRATSTRRPTLDDVYRAAHVDG